MIFPYVDIQYTPNMDQATLVREINKRFRLAYVELDYIFRAVELVYDLARTARYETTYTFFGDRVLTTATARAKIEKIAFQAYDGDMDVEPSINNTPIQLQGETLPVTADTTLTTYDTVDGSNVFEIDDEFRVDTTNGSLGDPLIVFAQFRLLDFSARG